MSLLEICQNVMGEVGWPILGSIASNTEGTAQQIFRIANTELRNLSQTFNWPHLETEYNFNTVIAQTVYLWPTDFRVPAQQSLFNKAEYYALKGSMQMQYWQLLKYGNLASLSMQKFRTTYPLGVPGLEIMPAPTQVQAMVGVYYSNEYAKDEDGNSIPKYATDNDVSKIPEEYVELGVKWRFRRAKGLDFSAELAEYNDMVKTQYAKYLSSQEIQVGGKRYPYEDIGLTQPYIPPNGFGI